MGGPDWGDGDYARTAATIAPATGVALDALAPRPGEHVLDVACGTGNATLEAVRRGARATGVDAAAGLLAAARARAVAEGLAAEFVSGDATALPIADASVDAVVSVFGVIFADDPARAASELVRVLRPGGRLVVTTWAPTGPIHAIGGLLQEALGAPPPVDGPIWGDPARVTAHLEEHGAAGARVDRHEISFTAASPEAWLTEQEAHHPLWRWARREVGEDRWPSLHDASLTALEQANEDPAAFRTTSAYLVVTARRP